MSCEEFLFFVLLPTGRIDRKIEFPLPDEKTKRRIFTIHTGRMTLAEDVNLEEYVMAKDDLSGADIKVQYEKKKRILTREIDVLEPRTETDVYDPRSFDSEDYT